MHRLFQNLNFRIRISRYVFLWCVTHQPGTYKMKHENDQIRMGSSIYLPGKNLG